MDSDFNVDDVLLQFVQRLAEQSAALADLTAGDVRLAQICEVADYLAPLNIRAMLDVPLRGREALVGVVCVEHVSDVRAWKIDERNFAMSVANLAMAAMVDDAGGRPLAGEQLHHASL